MHASVHRHMLRPANQRDPFAASSAWKGPTSELHDTESISSLRGGGTLNAGVGTRNQRPPGTACVTSSLPPSSGCCQLATVSCSAASTLAGWTTSPIHKQESA